MNYEFRIKRELYWFDWEIGPHPPSPSPCFLLRMARSRNDREGAVLYIFNHLHHYHIAFFSPLNIIEDSD